MPYKRPSRAKVNRYGRTVFERLMEHSVASDTNYCRIWTGATTKTPSGVRYGAIGVNGKNKGAHRAMYEAVYGITLPRHIDVHHKCFNTLCIQPIHLEACYRRQNMEYSRKAGRLNRKRFREENVIVKEETEE